MASRPVAHLTERLLDVGSDLVERFRRWLLAVQREGVQQQLGHVGVAPLLGLGRGQWHGLEPLECLLAKGRRAAAVVGGHAVERILLEGG
jgi:hypothetical protein